MTLDAVESLKNRDVGAVHYANATDEAKAGLNRGNSNCFDEQQKKARQLER